MNEIINELKYAAACIKYKCQIEINFILSMNDYDIKELYGLTFVQAAVLWNLMENKYNHVPGYNKKLFLWGLYFLKHYPTNAVMCHVFNASTPTVRKWVWYTIHCIACLDLVSILVCTFSSVSNIYL